MIFTRVASTAFNNTANNVIIVVLEKGKEKKSTQEMKRGVVYIEEIETS